MKTTFTCEICHTAYSNAEEAMRCEAVGFPVAKFNQGDLVYHNNNRHLTNIFIITARLGISKIGPRHEYSYSISRYDIDSGLIDSDSRDKMESHLYSMDEKTTDHLLLRKHYKVLFGVLFCEAKASFRHPIGFANFCNQLNNRLTPNEISALDLESIAVRNFTDFYAQNKNEFPGYEKDIPKLIELCRKTDFWKDIDSIRNWKK